MTSCADGLALEVHKAAVDPVSLQTTPRCRNLFNPFHPGSNSMCAIWVHEPNAHAAAEDLEEQPLYSTITRDAGIRIVPPKSSGSNRTVIRGTAPPPPWIPALPPTADVQVRAMPFEDRSQFMSEPVTKTTSLTAFSVRSGSTRWLRPEESTATILPVYHLLPRLRPRASCLLLVRPPH